MSTSDDLQARLEKLLTSLEEAKTALAPIKDEQVKLSSEKMMLQQSYQEQMESLRKKQQELDQKVYEAQVTVNNSNWEADQLKKQIEQQALAEAQAIKDAQEAAEREAQNNALTERFNKMTMGAKWREWAKDHQISAGHKIVMDRNVILADPMGLGKTLSSIISVEMAERATKDASPEHPFLGEEKEVYDYESNSYVTKIVNAVERPVGRRILYLCPNALLRNVLEEWRMWAPHRNVTFIGGMSKAERQFVMEHTLPLVDNYVIICNFEAWRRDTQLIDRLIACDFDTIIIDEAHNAKDMKSIAWKGINRLLTENRPEYVIPMTGTPILNRPEELFTLLNMVNPQKFYHLNDFLFSYCEQQENNNGTPIWVFKPGGLERIGKQIGQNFLRRTKSQAGVQLPEKTIIHHDLDVDEDTYPLQAKARKEMRQFATIVIDENEGKALSAAAVIAMYTRLRQIETWPAGIIQYRKDPISGKKTDEILLKLDVEESQKVDYVIHQDPNGQWNGLIPEAIEDERMVLFSQFKAPLREIRERCERAGYRAIVLDGDTPDNIKDEIRKDFDRRHTPSREDSKWDIVLCNYRVGGVGLNLTAATQLVVLDEEWNPGKRDQAYDRIHRIGQEDAVTIHVIRMNKTIDDWLAGIMETKESIVDGFMGAVTNGQAFKDALDSGLI